MNNGETNQPAAKRAVLNIIEKLVRRVKNPEFRFDSNVSAHMIFLLVCRQLILRLRAFKLVLRGRYIPGLYLGPNVSFRNFHLIKIEPQTKISEGVVLDGLGTDGLYVGSRASIGAYSRLVVSTSYADIGRGIRIGSDVAIGEFSYIGGAGGVSIGDGCIIGQYLSVHPENHIFTSKEVETRLQGVTRKGIQIGSNVWIGAKVTILDGADIGAGCIVGAGSVVRKGQYPDFSIIAGVPAKIISNR